MWRVQVWALAKLNAGRAQNRPPKSGRAQNGKIRLFVSFYVLPFFEKCTNYGQNKSQKVMFLETIFEKLHSCTKTERKKKITKSIKLFWFDVFKYNFI